MDLLSIIRPIFIRKDHVVCGLVSVAASGIPTLSRGQYDTIEEGRKAVYCDRRRAVGAGRGSGEFFGIFDDGIGELGGREFLAALDLAVQVVGNSFRGGGDRKSVA